MVGAGRRRIKGDRSFRRLLRNLPDAARAELADAMEGGGRELLAAQQAAAPSRSGALRRGLSMKLLKGSLRLRVGLIGKAVNRRLFYGRIVEFGRKASNVVVRRLARRTGKAFSYRMRIPARAGRPFVYTKRTDLRSAFRERLTRFWERTLGRASGGTAND